MIIDADRSGLIDLEEFVAGCMCLGLTVFWGRFRGLGFRV